MIKLALMVTVLIMLVLAVLIVLAVVVGLGHGCRGERQGGGDDGRLSCIIFACSAKFWSLSESCNYPTLIKPTKKSQETSYCATPFLSQ